MTNSMIPYSFVPGTKAKADEVNANFISLANFIEQNKNSTANDIETINKTLNEKADKTDLNVEHTVTEADTNLNDYKNRGTYIFSTLYTPTNIPKGEAGSLVVTGDENSVITQIWICNEENPEIFTRKYENEEWDKWYSTQGILSKNNPGYIRLPNGILIQWGFGTSSKITYPLAYSKVACPVFAKQGYSGTAHYADAGTATQSLTGLYYGCSGQFIYLNWIVIGY